MKNVVSLTKFSLTENISAGSNSLAINLSIDLITFFVVPTSYHILIEIPFILLKFLKYLNTRGNSWSSGSVRRKINWPGIVFICCNPEIGRVDFVNGKHILHLGLKDLKLNNTFFARALKILKRCELIINRDKRPLDDAIQWV